MGDWQEKDDLRTELFFYFNGNRSVGHTHSMMTGAENNPNVIVVVVSKEHGKLLEKSMVLTVNLCLPGEVARGRLRGRKGPVVVDNVVLFDLLRA